MGEGTIGRLQDYPFATVRLACSRCERQERYSRAKLIAAHGPDMAMLEVRRRIAACQRDREPGRSCGAYYPDLVVG